MAPGLNRRSRKTYALALVPLAIALTPGLTGAAFAASPVPLGTADSFALLAGSGISNTGSTTISGDIGLCCSTTSLTGFGPGADQVTQPSGTVYVGTGSPAATAQNDLDAAYTNAAGQAVTNTVGVDLSLSGTSANPLLPGVYRSGAGPAAFQINTGLYLDFQGNPNSVFIFQGTTLTTAAAAAGSVHIVNGGSTPSPCNIYWQLSDPTQGVTLGTGSAFKGTTMALGASVLGHGATVEGRILTRRDKAVTLDNNTITRSACFVAAPSGGSGGSTTPTPTGTPTTPSAGGSGGSPTPTGTTPPPATAAPSPPSATPASTPTGHSPSGTARLSGPSGPVSGPFTVSVTGHAIATVTFYVDGKHRATLHATPGRTKFTLTINPRNQSHSVHQVTARVTFTPASRTHTTTRRLVYRRPSPAPIAPRFTG